MDDEKILKAAAGISALGMTVLGISALWTSAGEGISEFRGKMQQNLIVQEGKIVYTFIKYRRFLQKAGIIR